MSTTRTRLQVAFGGAAIPSANHTVGTLTDGTAWATFDLPPLSPAVDTSTRIDILDDRGRRLWTGVVRRVTYHPFRQEVDVTDLTATLLSRRISPAGVPEPRFRFGDVIAWRGSEHEYKYVVLRVDESGYLRDLLGVDTRAVYRDRKDPANWEIVE